MEKNVNGNSTCMDKQHGKTSTAAVHVWTHSMEKPSTPIGMDTQHGKKINGSSTCMDTQHGKTVNANRYGHTAWKKRQRQQVWADIMEKASTAKGTDRQHRKNVNVSTMETQHGKNVNGNRTCMDTQYGKNVNGIRYGQTSWKKRQRQQVWTDNMEKTSTSALWTHSMEKTSTATVNVWAHNMEKTSTATLWTQSME